MALLLAHLSDTNAEAVMRRIKVGKVEMKRVIQHKRLLATLPGTQSVFLMCS
jgi:hypothetical protein